LKLFLYLSLSLLAFKSLASGGETICSSEEAISQVGTSGSCRLIVGSQKVQELAGTCTGKFRGVLPCQATYNIKTDGSTVQLLCGIPGEKPALNLVLNGSVAAYRASAIITKEDSTNVIINDSTIHTIFESGSFNMDLSNNETQRIANITLSLKTGPEVLTDVTCN
jgi:hypothetical protein